MADPVITSTPSIDATLTEDAAPGAATATGTLAATDPDAGTTFNWSVVGGATAAAAAYAFGLDNLTIVRNGVTILDDTFTDGSPPPSMEGTIAGGPTTYATTGGFTESGGRLSLSSTNALALDGVGTTDPIVGQAATVITNVAAGSTAGLRQATDFTVAGRFDLVLPDSARETYGIRLTDNLPGQPGNNSIELSVRQTVDGRDVVSLRRLDFAGDQVTVLGSIEIAPPPGADQIVLRLDHVAGSTSITASFDYLAGGVVVGARSFNATGTAFLGEDWLRAQVIALAPSISDSTLVGTYGVLNVDQAGRWTYSLANDQANVQALAAGQTVTDTFTVQVSDGTGGTDTEEIAVEVTGVNDAPTVVTPVPDQTGTEGVAFSYTIPAGSYSDVDAGDTLTLSAGLAEGPLPSWLTFNPATRTFSGTPGFDDAGSFQVYVDVSDASGSFTTDIFQITIAEGTPANQPPVADADGPYAATEDTLLTVSTADGVLAGDTDPEGGPLTAELVTPATFGTVGLNADGSFTYTPSPNFNGTDSFVYRAVDAGGLASQPVTVEIDVAAVNDAPTLQINAGNVTVDEDAGPQTVTAAATASAGPGDEGGQTVTYAVGNFDPALFAVAPSIDAAGNLTFTPAANASGTVVLSVVAEDNGGTANGGQNASAAQSITLTINAVNDAAIITGQTTGAVVEDAAQSTATGTLTVTDIDSAATFNVAANSPTANGYGLYSITAAGQWMYALDNSNPAVNALNDGQTLTDSFTVTTADGTAQTVTVTINGATDVVGLSNPNTAPSFTANGDGFALTPIGPGNDQGFDAVLQPDGKIVVAGIASNGSNNDFAVVRYNVDGSLDTAFGVGGKATTAFANGNDQAYKVALQSDGKIVVGGQATTATGALVYALARYNSDGSLDGSFGTGGRVTVGLGSTDSAIQSLALQADGKIVAGGYSFIGGSYRMTLIRLDSTGTLDTSFSGDGIATASLFQSSGARALSVQNDGKIIAGGFAFIGGVSGSGNDFAITRFNTDGTIDGSFGQVTTAIAAGFGTDAIQSVALTADGKIIAAGYTDVRGGIDINDIALVRYNSNGTLDTTFGLSGKVLTPVGTGNDFGASVKLLPDGRILVAGLSSNGTDNDVAVVRYNANGTLDTTFANGGKLVTPLGSGNDVGNSLILLADGKFIVAGTSNNGTNDDFLVLRYNPDGSLDWSFDGVSSLRGGALGFTENGSAILLDNSVQIFDAQLTRLDGVGNFGGATLTLARQGGANASDVFSVVGTPALAVGAQVLPGGANVTVTQNAGGTLALTFVAGTTQAQVNAALSAITYANSSDAFAGGTTTPIQIAWTFSDGNTGAQGTGGALSTTATTTVNIAGVNDAPIVAAAIANQTATEGAAFSFVVPADTFADADAGDTRTLSTSGNPAWLSFDAATGTFSGTPGFADAGTYTITLTAADGSGAQVSDQFELIVGEGTPPNTPPTVSGPVTLPALNEDSGRIITAAELLANASDANGDTLSVLNITTSSGTLTDNGHGTWSFQPATNDDTAVTFTYQVSDGVNPPVAASATLDLLPVNDAPVVSGSVTGLATEDGAPVALDALANATDPDTGNQLTFVNLPPILPAGVSIRSAGPVPLSDYAGISIPVGSNDGLSRPVAANVYSVTAPPFPIDTSLGVGYMVNPDPIDAFLGDLAFVFHDHHYVDLNVPDPARAVVTYQFATPTVIDSLDVIEHFNGITKLHAYVGNSLSTLTDIGSIFGSLGDITGSSVMFNGQHNLFDFNNTIAGTYLQVVIEKTSFANGYAFYRMVPEAASSTFELDPSHVAFQYLAAGQQTTVSVDYGVSDGVDVTPASMSWTIIGVNDAPTVAAAIPDQTATEGVAFTLIVPADTFADVDTIDTRTLSASVGGQLLPSWLTFDAATGTFSGTPGFSDAGTYTITLTVTDGSGAQVSDQFGLTVGEGTPPNTPPTISGPVALTALNEDTVRTIMATELLANASDANGDTLSVLSLAASSGTLTDTGNGTWSFQPAANDDTGVTFTYEVSDGVNAPVAASATLDLLPVNDAPAASNFTVDRAEDTAVTFDARDFATDPDGDTLTVTAVSAASGTVVINADGTITYTPAANFYGSDALNYTVSDGRGGTATASIEVGITPVNDEQTAPATNSVTTAEDTASAAIVIGAVDIDGDALTYAIKPGASPAKGTVAFDQLAGTFAYTPNANANGTDTFTILIDDGQGAVSEQVVSVSIASANDPAVIGGALAGAVTEDSGAGQVVTGQLTIADADGAADETFLAGTIAGTYGSFSLTAAGAWTYTLDNALPAVQALNAGQTLPDTITVQSADGTTAAIAITINGANEATVITNGNGGGTVSGTAGDDVFDTAGGNDTVNAGAGNDTITAGSGADVVNAGAGNDTIIAGPGDGNDTYNGGSGVDTVDYSAISANLTIDLTGSARSAQSGRDALNSIENAIGGSGNDHIDGNGAANVIEGGAGADELFGLGGSDTLLGGAGNDTLDGGTGADVLRGGSGNDRMFGGGGADTIEGGTGNDLMTGGGGADAFVFNPGFGNDQITDFDANPAGGQDLIDLAAFEITLASFGSRVSIADVGADTLVTIDNDPAQTIRLLGIGNATTVTVDDFRFI